MGTIGGSSASCWASWRAAVEFRRWYFGQHDGRPGPQQQSQESASSRHHHLSSAELGWPGRAPDAVYLGGSRTIRLRPSFRVSRVVAVKPAEIVVACAYTATVW